MNRVVVLGSINRDLVLGLEHLPVPGETVRARHLEVLHGGKGANQAVAAAAIGGSVALVGRVGTDTAGPEQVSALVAAGVDVSFVRKDPRAPTGTAVVMVDGAGRNSIAVVPGANGLLDAVSVEQAAPLIEQARILLLQLEVPDGAVERAVAVARRAHVETILNIAPYRDLPPDVLRRVGYLLANETEAAALLGRPVDGIDDAAQAADAMRRLGPSWGIITLGEQGTVAAGEGGWFHEAPAVQTVEHNRRGRRVRRCAGRRPGRGPAGPRGGPAGYRRCRGQRDPPWRPRSAARRRPRRPATGAHRPMTRTGRNEER